MDINEWIQTLVPEDALTGSLLLMCIAAVVGLTAYYWRSPWARPGQRKVYFDG